MTFEELLKEKLSVIEAFNDNIYPLAVPEEAEPPYVSYCLSDGRYLKTLDGEEPWELTYEINILASMYKDLKPLEDQVTDALRSLKGSKVDNGKVHQVDVEIPSEKYEEEVRLQRANISFTVYF